MRKRNIIADSAPVAKSGHAPPDAAPFRDFARRKAPAFQQTAGTPGQRSWRPCVGGGFYDLWPACAQRPSSFPASRSPLLTGAASAVVDGRTLGVDMVPAYRGSLARRARRRLLSDPGKGGLDAAAPHPAGHRKARSSATPGLSACLRLADGKNALCRACGRKATAGLRLRRATACSER